MIRPRFYDTFHYDSGIFLEFVFPSGSLNLQWVIENSFQIHISGVKLPPEFGGETESDRVKISNPDQGDKKHDCKQML